MKRSGLSFSTETTKKTKSSTQTVETSEQVMRASFLKLFKKVPATNSNTIINQSMLLATDTVASNEIAFQHAFKLETVESEIIGPIRQQIHLEPQQSCLIIEKRLREIEQQFEIIKQEVIRNLVKNPQPDKVWQEYDEQFKRYILINYDLAGLITSFDINKDLRKKIKEKTLYISFVILNAKVIMLTLIKQYSQASRLLEDMIKANSNAEPRRARSAEARSPQ